MADESTTIKDGFVRYLDKPLVRRENMIVYGDMSDKYYLCMLIMSQKKLAAADPRVAPEVPDQILVQILSTDKSKSPEEQLVKQFQKGSLYEAFDIGIYWLDRLNSGN